MGFFLATSAQKRLDICQRLHRGLKYHGDLGERKDETNEDGDAVYLISLSVFHPFTFNPE